MDKIRAAKFRRALVAKAPIQQKVAYVSERLLAEPNIYAYRFHRN